MDEAMFTVNPAEIAAIGALLGALTGAITFLFKALIEAKDKTITMVIEDRDYWRDVARGDEPHPEREHRSSRH